MSDDQPTDEYPEITDQPFTFSSGYTMADGTQLRTMMWATRWRRRPDGGRDILSAEIVETEVLTAMPANRETWLEHFKRTYPQLDAPPLADTLDRLNLQLKSDDTTS